MLERFYYEYRSAPQSYLVYDRLTSGSPGTWEEATERALARCRDRHDAERIVAALNAAEAR